MNSDKPPQPTQSNPTQPTPTLPTVLAPKSSITISPQLQTSPYYRSDQNILYPPTRKWQIRFTNQQAQALYTKDLECVITMKIRGEEACSYVPEKLYSSHKYVVEHIVCGSIAKDYPLLVAKIQVLNPRTNEEILKNKKPILKGSPEAALTFQTEGLEGKMKIQFTDVSYHHEKGYFYFKISYFDPKDLTQSLFELVSPPFRVYARKPSIPKETLKPHKPKPLPKPRKKRVKTEDTQDKKAKKPKTEEESIYDQFEKKLEELATMKQHLSEEDLRIANESSLEKLLAIDPEYTIDFFLKPTMQMNTNLAQQQQQQQQPLVNQIQNLTNSVNGNLTSPINGDNALNIQGSVNLDNNLVPL